MPAAKKYKLFSAAAVSESGFTPLCAFFASEAGCRNGENCKFKHALPDDKALAATPSSSSVVSSESEGEEAGENSSSGIFATPDEVAAKKAQEQAKKEAKPKKKNKKKRKSSDGNEDNSGTTNNIFANPKKGAVVALTQKKQKTMQERSPAAVSPPPLQRHPAKEQNRSTPRDKQSKRKANQNEGVPSFRNLNLPITSFSIPPSSKKEEETQKRTVSKAEEETSDVSSGPPPRPPLPLPKSTPTALKWQKALLKTRAHDRYDGSFTFSRYKEMDESAGIGSASEWIKARPFGDWCASNPQAIAIDCEMCETKDPVSGVTNPKALCRVSVINAEKPDEVLLDTLVKPAWPVVDYRTWVNGIKEEHLENVQFTLRHAQAFLMALCSEETIVLGHALHNDLVALKMEHHCNVDSAMLFTVKDSPGSTPGLKDLAKGLLQKDMPNAHDSVNDARTALSCLELYVKQDGNVEPVVRTARNNRTNNGNQLFVHRIPRVCQPSHLSSMFLMHTCIQPSEVGELQFSGDSGKTLVTFQSTRHANLAFDSLEGNEEPDKSGKMQKKVFLRNGDYVRVRKMIYNQNRDKSPKK